MPNIETVDCQSRLGSKMLLALNAPVTAQNLARLAFFAGILAKAQEKPSTPKEIEALIAGIDMGDIPSL